MRIVDAWRAGYNGDNVVVTILDDGLETSHPDITRNYVSMVYLPARLFCPTCS